MQHLKSILSLFLIFVLLSVSALADKTVPLDPRTSPMPAVGAPVSALRISGVEAPSEGLPLDSAAEVTSAEGVSWEIPALWIGSDGSFAEGTAKAASYRLVLAFYVPSGYIPGEDSVSFDDAVYALFGEDGPVSVFNEDSGITYFLASNLVHLVKPAAPSSKEREDRDDSVSSYSSSAQPETPANESGTPSSINETVSESSNELPQKTSPENPYLYMDSVHPEDEEKYIYDSIGGDSLSFLNEAPGFGGDPASSSSLADLVQIHCSNTAREALPQKDLETLVDLIINKIEPQAVNLLIKSFPAFQKAEKNGELSRNIGLYIYFKNGDQDGIRVHENAPSGALAYVASSHWNEKTPVFGQFMGVDASEFTEQDQSGNNVLATSEKKRADLENTVVHEMLHAFMNDYTRVGATGIVNPRDPFDDNVTAKDFNANFANARFPIWLTEGIASAVENVYQYRMDSFDLLARYTGSGKMIATNEASTMKGVRTAYLTETFTLENCKKENKLFDLQDATKKDAPTTAAKYVSGYLAALYIGQMSSKHAGNGSAILLDSNNYIVGFSDEKIRSGLNSVLESIHEGKTLDEVINTISEGKYKSTKQFEQEFLKGTFTPNPDKPGFGWYNGDDPSLSFVTDYLNYMRFNVASKNSYYPNGSILFPLDKNYVTPLDSTQDATSSVYQIAPISTYAATAADMSKSYLSGGTSINQSTAAYPTSTLPASGANGIAAKEAEASLPEDGAVAEGLSEGAQDPLSEGQEDAVFILPKASDPEELHQAGPVEVSAPDDLFPAADDAAFSQPEATEPAEPADAFVSAEPAEQTADDASAADPSDPAQEDPASTEPDETAESVQPVPEASEPAEEVPAAAEPADPNENDVSAADPSEPAQESPASMEPAETAEADQPVPEASEPAEEVPAAAEPAEQADVDASAANPSDPAEESPASKEPEETAEAVQPAPEASEPAEEVSPASETAEPNENDPSSADASDPAQESPAAMEPDKAAEAVQPEPEAPASAEEVPAAAETDAPASCEPVTDGTVETIFEDTESQASFPEAEPEAETAA